LALSRTGERFERRFWEMLLSSILYAL